MLLNARGIAICNPNAKYVYHVDMHYGRTRWTVDIPADTEQEAIVVAENESPCGIHTGQRCKIISG